MLRYILSKPFTFIVYAAMYQLPISYIPGFQETDITETLVLVIVKRVFPFQMHV